MVDRMSRRTGLALAAAALLLAAPEAPRAEDGAFPTKPIQVIVPFKPGGRTDTVARLIANAIEENGWLDQPMVVVNVDGGAGANAVNALRREAADGHAILHWHHQALIAMAMGLGDFSLEDFQSIGYTGGGSPVWTVQADAPYETLDDLVQTLKAEPRSLVEAVGIGTIPHFVGAMLAKDAGFETRYVTANSGADRMRLLLGGNADIALFAASEYLAGGDGLKPLVYFGKERLPELPDTPTSTELGHQVSWANPNWWLAPAEAPEDHVAAIAEALKKAIEAPEIREYFRENTLEPYWTPGEEAMEDAKATLELLEPVAAEIQ
jgi:tripartite-type tricarboxylate transporter receptor subunit TctC